MNLPENVPDLPPLSETALAKAKELSLRALTQLVLIAGLIVALVAACWFLGGIALVMDQYNRLVPLAYRMWVPVVLFLAFLFLNGMGVRMPGFSRVSKKAS